MIEAGGAAEWAAFESGRYAELLLSRCEPVPVWAWLNALAHANGLRIATLAATDTGENQATGDTRSWFQVRRLLADELVGMVTGGLCSLVIVQRQVLQALELELAASDGWIERDPLSMAWMTLDALGEFRFSMEQAAGE
ncbi:MAG: hypothetical protein ACYDA2_02760 [Acidimicrobiales bacterium]